MGQLPACVILGMLALATACSTASAPTAPSAMAATTAPTPTPAPGPSPHPGPFGGTFPAIVQPARVFNATSVPVYAYHGGELWSRYVLYDSKAFALQYSSHHYPFFEYKGTYTEVDGGITFHWEGWSTAGPWGATGTLAGDVLTVSYNVVMQLSDFENGTFILVK